MLVWSGLWWSIARQYVWPGHIGNVCDGPFQANIFRPGDIRNLCDDPLQGNMLRPGDICNFHLLHIACYLCWWFVVCMNVLGMTRCEVLITCRSTNNYFTFRRCVIHQTRGKLLCSVQRTSCVFYSSQSTIEDDDCELFRCIFINSTI